MKILFRLLVVAAFVVNIKPAAAMGWVFAEEHEITSGEFRGFSVGSTKEAAMDNLVRLGAQGLAGISLPFGLADATRDPAAVMRLLETGNGIRIFDGQALDIRLYLEGEEVVRIENVRSREVGEVWSGLRTRASVIKQVRATMNTDPLARVESIGRIDVSYWAMVNKDPKKAIDVLRGYDGWEFAIRSEKPGGAIYRLYFRDDRLVQLEYHRARFIK